MIMTFGTSGMRKPLPSHHSTTEHLVFHQADKKHHHVIFSPNDVGFQLWLGLFRTPFNWYLCVVLTKCFDSLLCWKANSCPDLPQGCFCTLIHSPFSPNPHAPPCPCCWKTSSQHEASTTTWNTDWCMVLSRATASHSGQRYDVSLVSLNFHWVLCYLPD